MEVHGIPYFFWTKNKQVYSYRSEAFLTIVDEEICPKPKFHKAQVIDTEQGGYDAKASGLLSESVALTLPSLVSWQQQLLCSRILTALSAPAQSTLPSLKPEGLSLGQTGVLIPILLSVLTETFRHVGISM